MFLHIVCLVFVQTDFMNYLIVDLFAQNINEAKVSLRLERLVKGLNTQTTLSLLRLYTFN